MKFLSSVSAIALAGMLLFPSALSMPTSRDQCHPNLSGRPVSIFPESRSKEWGPGILQAGRSLQYKNPSSEAGEFYLPFTGQPDNSYHIKSVFAPANDFYVTIATRGPYLIWSQSDTGAGNPWQISCTWCAPADATFWNSTYARGCTLSPRDRLCADEFQYGTIDSPNIGLCNGSPSQLWELVLPRP